MTTVFKNQIQNNLGPTASVTVTATQASTPSAGSVTYTFATQTTALFPVGSYILISGSSVSGYNGTFGPVTASTTGSVTVANTTTGAATGGTISNVFWSTNPSAKTTVIGFSLTNTTGYLVTANVQISDTVAGTTANYINNVPVPANQSLRIVTGGEKLILGPSTNVIVSSNQSSSLDALLSFVEIS